jgi:hypothetical protein
MAIYSLGLRTTDVTQNHANVEIYTPSTLAIKIMEIGLAQVTATACIYGLGRPAAQGVTPVPVLFQAEQNSSDPAAKTNASLSWGTSPTQPTIFMRRVATPAAVGAGVIWTFPRGLQLPASSSIVIWNISNPTVACDVWIVIDE